MKSSISSLYGGGVCLLALLFSAIMLPAQGDFVAPFEDEVSWTEQSSAVTGNGDNFEAAGDLTWNGDNTGSNTAIKFVSTGNDINATFTGNFIFENNTKSAIYSDARIYNTVDAANSTITFLTDEYNDHSLFIFRNNTVDGNTVGGGAIASLSYPGSYVSSGGDSSVTISATKQGGIFFVNNVSCAPMPGMGLIQGDGGGIYSSGGTSSINLSVSAGDILFSANTAGLNGGGIHSYAYGTTGTSSVVNLSVVTGDIRFIKNTAGGDGGGISAKGEARSTSSVNLSVLDNGNISFIKNTAGGDGGGIFSSGYGSNGFIGSEVNLYVNIGDISFIKNTAGVNGGGIFSSGASSTLDLSVDIGNISFIKNATTDYSGGGLYSYGTHSSSVVLSVLGTNNISFIKNTAGGGGGGGGLYSKSGYGSSFVDLSIDSGGIFFIENTAGNFGGGIYSYGGFDFSTVNLSVGDEGQILFTGNKHYTDIANAIYFDKGFDSITLDLNINIGKNGTAAFYDPITATTAYNTSVQVNLNADDSTGLFIFDGHDYIDSADVNRYYDMVNDTVLHNGTLVIANNVIYGRNSKDSTLLIGNGATLLSVQDFDLGREYMKNIINADITLNNSTLAFINEITDTYHTLNINSLDGNSGIYLNFNSDSGDTDVLDIAEGAGGTHTVSSIGIGDGTLLRIEDVIKVGEETQSNIFTGGGTVTPLYYYNLEQNDDSGNWDLVRTLTETSDVTLDSFGSLSVGWFTQLSSLNKRLGQLHAVDYNTHNEDVWIRSFGGQVDAKFSVPNSVRFKEYNYGFDFGGDWLTTDNETNKMIVGLYGGYMRADRNFKDAIQSTGKTTSYYGGLYSTWINNNGLYFDFVTKIQDFRTSFDIDTDSAEFSNYGFGASIESGRPYGIGDGFFIEPRAQVSYLHLNSTKFNFKNSGDQVRVNDANIYRFLGGAKFGQLTSVGSDNKPFIWYVSADVEKQISAGGKIETMDESYSSATDGIRSVFGLGIMYDDSDSSQAYFNFESSFGEKYNRPWNIIGGYRKMF